MQARLLMSGLALAAASLSLGPPAPAAGASPAPAPRIAWFGTWKEGLAEAKRSRRPILLIAAAPHCHNISGMW